MSDPIVTCPKCKSEFKLNESLAAPLLEQARRQYLQQAAAERAAIEESARRLAREETSFERAQRDRELADLRAVIEQTNRKLTEAQDVQVKAVQERRALEEERREMVLTVEQRVSELVGPIEEKARARAAEESRLRIAEMEKMLADARRQAEDMRLKMERRSPQLQGELLELSLEAELRTRFSTDAIEEVAKGDHGGDIVQRINAPNGRTAGIILWESKQTKTWSDGWLAKLRDDARAAAADAAIIVSQVLPKGMEAFGEVEGVWVASPRHAAALGVCLRQRILLVAAARQAGEGRQTKMGIVYEYLTGPEFVRRVEAIVEAYTTMREDLEQEKKALQSQWAKRDRQLDLALTAATGMYGDIRAIAGKSVAEIEGLGLGLLTG